jgi:hypothetical protein
MIKLANIILSLLFFFQVFFSLAQLNSYEFKNILPPGGKEVEHVETKYFGTYEQVDEKVSYTFEADGVYAESILYLSISKATIRESSKYDVRDNYLFGVKENDSIPCIFEDDVYYYGLKDKVKIAGSGTKNKIVQLSSALYCINYFDNGTYSPSIIEFKGQHLIVKHFDYENETTLFNLINEKERINHRVVLNPTLEEWQALDKSVIFPQQRDFNKRKD